MFIQEDDKSHLREVEFEDKNFRTASGTRMRRICVAVAHKNGAVAVRDTKDPNRTTLVYSEDEWNAFIAGVKAGEFDLPID